jgi:hypothetical protein
VASPYLERPLRTLEQALKDCGRARDESATIVTLPSARGADRHRAACAIEDPVDCPAERVGASA